MKRHVFLQDIVSRQASSWTCLQPGKVDLVSTLHVALVFSPFLRRYPLTTPFSPLLFADGS